MKLGYITFSNEEQQFVHRVIQQINQGAIDELGFGRIRDAFSDEMFPGMSTLHRRSKYFVLLPTLYNQLSQQINKDSSDIRSLIRKWEINMTISLLKGTNSNDIGITGSSIGITGLENGQFVKITPTNIYLEALRFLGLVNNTMSLTNLIKQQSKRNMESKKARRTRDEIAEDPDGTDTNIGYKQNFVSFPGYRFDQISSIDLQLTEYEARILKGRIINNCLYSDGKPKLYSYILQNEEIEIQKNFFDLKKSIDKFPKPQMELKETYYMACDFSKWAHLMNTYYRYIFNLKAGQQEIADKLKGHIKGLLSSDDIPQSNRINEILQHIKSNQNFKDVNYLCYFCLEAARLLDNIDNKEADLIKLITEREQKIKRNHYKIGNPRYESIDYSNPSGYYSYRWEEIVFSMISDIRNPKK
jgi:hypothetical protein